MMVITYLMFLCSNLLSMLEPLVTAGLVNMIQTGSDNILRDSVLWLLLFPLIEIVFWVFHGFGRIFERKTAFIVAQNYTEEMFRKITDMPLKWHRDHHTGESYDKIDKARKALFDFSDHTFDKIGTLLKLTLSLIAVIYFIPKYGLVTILCGLAIILIVKKYDKILIKHEEWINDAENKVSSALFDYISNITTVITLRLEKLSRKTVSNRISHIFKTFNQRSKDNEVKWFFTSMITNTGSILIIFLYIYNEISLGNTIMLGSLMALWSYIMRVNDSFFGIAWQWESTIFQSTKLKSAETISRAHHTLTKNKTNLKTFPKWRNITISNLRFKYEDDHKKTHHIKDLTLHLKRGYKIALVGESGSGKSTLMQLLRGLDIPEKGSMSIDGKQYKSISVLSNTTTLMPQEPEIFENTIEYNITAGIKHKKSEVTKAVKLAEFNQVLKRLPKGLDSSIKEKGVNLSGGEKQRLALARGIFAAKDSSIILLDEPTSSVDSMNEKKIHLNLFRHFKNQCIISSIHRLNLLPLFNHIYILENGKLVEEGSYKNLSVKEKGHLKTMLKNYQSEHKRKHGTLETVEP
jgi:ATP-binding cassette, subfamily B, bacterial